MLRHTIKSVIVTSLILAACSGNAYAAPQLIQGWQNINVHAHEEWQNPMFQTITPGLKVPVTILHHNNGKTAQWVRWSDGSNVKQVINFRDYTPGPVYEFRTTHTLTLNPRDFDAWGWREVRISANFGSPRDFGTSRWCVFVPYNGKSRSDYCGGPTTKGRCGGGWWYPETEYSIVFVDCRDIQKVQTRILVAGEKIRARAESGRLKAHIDPDFHNNKPGMVVPVVDGAVTIPSLRPGQHKLHLRDERSNGQAGAYVVVFNVW